MEVITMLAAVALREDFTAAGLRAMASRSRNAQQCARLQALAGVPRGEAVNPPPPKGEKCLFHLAERKEI
jgi:hypothetical protein